jgi:hypothetical protein
MGLVARGQALHDSGPMRATLTHWLSYYSGLPWPAQVGLVLGLFVITSAIGLIIAVRLPRDAFVKLGVKASRPRPWKGFGIVVLLLRNGSGAVLFIAGLVMSVPLIPGPGALFMLLGLGVADFPGKYRLELMLIRLPHVLSSANRLRARFGKPPLLDPPA